MINTAESKCSFIGTGKGKAMKTVPHGFASPSRGRGKQRGTMFIPRVGDEVLIDFLHGDLRRPIVLGSLYNGEDKPPYSLPPDKPLRPSSRTAQKGGGGSNEHAI